jgi:hypothetical protein
VTTTGRPEQLLADIGNSTQGKVSTKSKEGPEPSPPPSGAPERCHRTGVDDLFERTLGIGVKL